MAINITGSQNLSAVAGITQTDLTHSTVADGLTFAASSSLTVDKSSFQCQQILLNNTTATLNTGANNGDGTYAKNAIVFIQPASPQNQSFSTNPPMSLLGKCNLLNTEFVAGPNIAPTDQSTFVGEFPTQAAALTGGANRILKNVQFRAINKNGVTMFMPQATFDNVTFDRIDLVFFEAQPISSNNLKITNSSWGLAVFDKSLSFANSTVSRVTIQRNSVNGNTTTLTNVAVSERYMFRMASTQDLTVGYILKSGFVGVSGTNGAIACIFNGSNALLNAATSDANGNWAQVNLTWATFTAGSVGAAPTSGIAAQPDNAANFVTSANITTWQTTTPAKFTSLVVPIKVLHMGYAYQSQYQEIATIDTTLAAYAAPFSYSAKLPLDLNVTLSNSAALALLVSAVTINKTTNTVTLASAVTLDNLYDASKAFKTKSDGTNAAYPTPATSFFTATGTTADFGSMPIAGVNNLTSGTKFQTLKSTGSITASGAMANLSVQGNVSQATPTNLTGVTITGNLTFNTNTPITVTFTNCTVTGTVSNSGTGLVTITRVNTTIGTVGANVATQQFATIAAPNLLVGTRVRLYNVTDSVELFNGVLAGAGFSQSFQYTTNKTMRLTATYTSGATAKLGVSATGVFEAGGLTFLDSQVDDTAYNTYAIDGSAITKFSADYGNDTTDIVLTSDYSAQEFYAWWIYNLTTEQGIREFFGGVTAVDEANIRRNATVLDMYLDNETTTNIVQSDNRRFYRDDFVYPVKRPTTGGGGVDVVWRNTILIATNDSATIAAAVHNYTVEAGMSYDEMFRVQHSALTGKVSGANTTTERFRDIADSKDRIVYTVDANGNRTAVAQDGA